MSTAQYANPFRTWATLASELRDRFSAELGAGESEKTPWAIDLLASMSAIATRCKALGITLERMEQHDPAAFEAFLRALEGG
jgi:hypothetical protein